MCQRGFSLPPPCRLRRNTGGALLRRPPLIIQHPLIEEEMKEGDEDRDDGDDGKTGNKPSSTKITDMEKFGSELSSESFLKHYLNHVTQNRCTPIRQQ